MAKNTAHKMTDREIEIGGKIRQACLAVSNDLTLSADAKDAKKSADESVEKGRLPVIRQVAQMAVDENWTAAESMWGCDYAANVQGNDDRIAKTIANFCADMKNVTHPAVRNDVSAILTACELAWKAEGDAMELDKKAPRPLRDFAKRQYHLVIRAIKEQRLGTIYISHPADVIQWAEANDPAKNPDMVADQIATIAEQLAAIFVNFDHADITEASGVLAKIDAKALRACRVHPDMTSTLPKPPQRPAQQPAQKPVETPTVGVATPLPAEPLAAVQRLPSPPSVDASPSPVDGVAGLDDFLDHAGALELAEAAD